MVVGGRLPGADAVADEEGDREPLGPDGVTEVVVLDEGRGLERGTHQELLGRDELYRRQVEALRIGVPMQRGPVGWPGGVAGPYRDDGPCRRLRAQAEPSPATSHRTEELLRHDRAQPSRGRDEMSALTRLRGHAQRRPLLDVVHDATLAASVHNSQPWRFVISPGRIEVWLDIADRPTIIDADGRWALQSLGAAVANVELGVRCRLQVPVQVQLLPGPPAASLAALAGAPVVVITFGAGTQAPDQTELQLHSAIPTRRTSRWPAPGDVEPETVLEIIEAVEGQDGARGVTALLPGPDQTSALLALTAEVDRDWRNDVAYLAEVERWAGRGDGLGIPAQAMGPQDSDGQVPGRDFSVGVSGPRATPAPESFERSPRLLVLRTPGDGYADWLGAGAAMERAMLSATAHGVDVGVLGQLVEDDRTRAAAQTLLGGTDRPWTVQQVLRLGRSDPGTHPAATPRRKLAAVVSWHD